MKTAKFALSLIIIALASATLSAQQAAQWTGSAEIRYAGKHLFRGVQQSRQALQVSAGYESAGNGFRIGGWLNQPFHDDYNNELDLTAGYRHSLWGVQFDAGLTAYLYPEADTDAGETGSSCELSLGASREVLPKAVPGWTVAGRIDYDMRLETRTFEAATAYSLPFHLDRYQATADFSMHLGVSHSDNLLPDLDAPNVKDQWTYFGAVASVTVRFSKLLSATGGLQYGRAHGHLAGRDATDKLWGFIGTGLSW
ncbi:MAG: hypothetical protein LBI02_07450 [Opitutaceae bacterium]|jgi:uncharacterized protein (TIGR02001 family)|nr:hypothetical protein [Opitutaceae bacterium]